MWKTKGYRGKRSDYRQAFKVKLKRPDPKDRWEYSKFTGLHHERIDWCEENCTGEWHTADWGSPDVYWFERRNDAIMFKLVWGGSI